MSKKIPFLAIMIAEMASGKHPPAAKNVKPITASGISKAYPITETIHTTCLFVDHFKYFFRFTENY